MEDTNKLAMINSMPHVHKRYMHTKRDQTIIYSLSGKELAIKTRIFKRNKCIQELINITIEGEKHVNALEVMRLNKN